MVPGALPIVAQLDPQSVAAAATVYSSGWKADTAPFYIADIAQGAGTGSAAITVQQCSAADGTGAKAYSAVASVTLATAQTATQIRIPVNAADLDLANGFVFLRVKVVVTGGSGTLYGGTVVAGDVKYSAGTV